MQEGNTSNFLLWRTIFFKSPPFSLLSGETKREKRRGNDMTLKCKCGNKAEVITNWGETLCNDCIENKCTQCPLNCEELCFKSINSLYDGYYEAKENTFNIEDHAWSYIIEAVGDDRYWEEGC